MPVPLNSRISTWSHELLGEVLQPGDLAVDLTAGNGCDTLFLARSVGRKGLVLTFDVQQEALARTSERLAAAGFSSAYADLDEPLADLQAAVGLVAAGHENLAKYLFRAPRAIIANLGYLPGGDRQIATSKETTLAALAQGAGCLAVGGRIAVVVYVGHPNGREEGAAVDQLFEELPPQQWSVMKLSLPNMTEAPFLVVAEKVASPVG